MAVHSADTCTHSWYYYSGSSLISKRKREKKRRAIHVGRLIFLTSCLFLCPWRAWYMVAFYSEPECMTNDFGRKSWEMGNPVSSSKRVDNFPSKSMDWEADRWNVVVKKEREEYRNTRMKKTCIKYYRVLFFSSSDATTHPLSSHEEKRENRGKVCIDFYYLYLKMLNVYRRIRWHFYRRGIPMSGDRKSDIIMV